MSSNILKKFVRDQLSCWPLACQNFRALKAVESKTMTIAGLEVVIQHNPARVVSSAAKLDKESVAKRKCFLCNRFPEQFFIRYEGRKSKKYDILLNPYPIFPEHLVIAMSTHCDQSIWQRYIDILDLSKTYSSYTFFYNGPHSGASAPDHHHFQATPRGLMPLEKDVQRILTTIKEKKSIDCRTHEQSCSKMEHICSLQDALIYSYKKYVNGVFVLKAKTSKSMAKLFYRLLDCAPLMDSEPEPLINLISWFSDGEYKSVVVFRQSHRSHHYFAEGSEHLTMSPGCADMGGYIIVPMAEDFAKLTPELLTEVLNEVCISESQQNQIINRLTREQELISVGIMSAKEIDFELFTDGAGVRTAKLVEGKIEYDGALYDELFFEEQTLSTMFAEPSFALHNVTIGKDFHWERRETQKFAGALKIIIEKDRLTAVNLVGIEDYLLSVISSEMSATSSLEFLKAHAVISRSWVKCQMEKSRSSKKDKHPSEILNISSLVTYLDGKINNSLQYADSQSYKYIKWYDHEDHKLYDVCADDHCQRYQGLTRAVGKSVKDAIDQTWGQILYYNGEVCDARFSKCCGGVMERFSTCWEDEDKDYLQALPDSEEHLPQEECFCNTKDSNIIKQVLNNYDQETQDFFEWEQSYSVSELSSLVKEKSGIDIGIIQSIEALEKGPSGRIKVLEIKGNKARLVVGKELEIRRILSKSHLKSSAFSVTFKNDFKESYVLIKGRGWGHGVGLCQIGAAVMASKSYTYKQILEHYYPGTVLYYEYQ